MASTSLRTPRRTISCYSITFHLCARRSRRVMAFINGSLVTNQICTRYATFPQICQLFPTVTYAYSVFRLLRKVLSDHLLGMKPTTLQNGLTSLAQFILLLVRAVHLSTLQPNTHFMHPALPEQATVLIPSQPGTMDWIPTST